MDEKTGHAESKSKKKEYEVIAICDENGKTFEELMEQAFKLIITNGR